MKTYTQIKYGEYEEAESSATLRSSGADYGGGSEVLIVETLVFDEAQVTSKLNGNRPVWGGSCHTLSAGNAGQAVVIIREKQNVVSDNGRDAEPRSASG